MLNVNAPVDADLDTPRVVTEIALVDYAELFRSSQDGRFVHDSSGRLPRSPSLEGTDVEAVRQGRVSITPVRLAHSVEVEPPFRRVLERTDP